VPTRTEQCEGADYDVASSPCLDSLPGMLAGRTLSRLPMLLPFSFLPSRLLAPTELCARRLGPLVSHLDDSGFIRDWKVSKKSER